jgi:hypothetical protein
MMIWIVIAVFVLVMTLNVITDIRKHKEWKAGTRGCDYCGRFPVCVECGRCGDSSCNSGCIFCTDIKGARRYLPTPMKLRDNERLIAKPKEVK